MDIARYTSYFHDGEILDITHINNNIVMTLESAEVDTDFVKDIPLSEHNRIIGKLHINGVKSILNNEKEFKNKLKMILSYHDLHHLEIKGNIVFFEISWYGKTSEENDFYGLEIHATEVWWENLPHLSRPSS